MVVLVRGRMLGQHLEDGRHGEGVGDAMLLHEREDLGRVEPAARQQHARHAARDLHHLVQPRAVRKRGDDERTIGAVRQAGHQVGQVVGDDELQLPMGQHARFRTPGRAGRVEEPGRVVAIDPHGRDRIRPGCERLPFVAEVDHRQARRGRVLSEHVLRQHQHRAALPGDEGHVVGHEAEVDRHPDGTERPAGIDGLEHRQPVARLHDDAVAPADATFPQARCGGADAGAHLAPGRDAHPLDQRRMVRQPVGRLVQRDREVGGGGGDRLHANALRLTEGSAAASGGSAPPVSTMRRPIM